MKFLFFPLVDTIMVGSYNDEPIINPDEVAHWKWITLEDVKTDMVLHPEHYTEWFRIIFEKFYEHINIV